MTRYGMVIDAERCTGCYNCFLSCRDEFAGNDYPGYAAAQPMKGMNWTTVKEIERGQYPHVKVNHVPVGCMQCDDCNAMKAEEDGAMYRRADGIVMIDPEKAKGRRSIVSACPYRQIEWNEEQDLPQKCIFCAHLLDAGEPEPRCVEACPTGARVFGDLDDPDSEVSRLVSEGTEIMHPEYGLSEKVSYRNLPQKFVAGTVVLGDLDEVAVGAEVTLTGGGETHTARTNGFGDFEFEGLRANIDWNVDIATPGYEPRSLRTKTSRDQYLGEVVLAAAKR